MILAGGMSTRLYPLTKEVPKPLVPIAGEPNSGHLMRYLKSYGIDEVAINVHYLADKIVDTFGDGAAYGVKLTYLHEKKLMGSAGGVKQMESFLRGETFVVIGCDAITDMRLDDLLAFHKDRKAVASIGLAREEDVSQYGVVITDPDGRIVDFQEKPPKGTERSNLVNTGLYVFEPEIFDRIPAGEFWDFGNNVFPELQKEKAPFYGREMTGAYWRDIGTINEYRTATREVLAGHVKLVGKTGHFTGYPADAIIGDGVTIEGDVLIGSRANIGDESRIIGPCVIGDRVRIGNGTVIENSIVWEDTTIGSHARIIDSIVGQNYKIASGVALEGSVVANEPEPVR